VAEDQDVQVRTEHGAGMAALDVPSGSHGAATQSSAGMLSFLLVMLAGPLAALAMSAVIVMFDSDVIMGSDEHSARSSAAAHAPAAVAGRDGSASHHGPRT